MAVIIQEVIGNEHNGRYYPEISGVAQSYNFYPFSYIQPEEGLPSPPSGWRPTSWVGKRYIVQSYLSQTTTSLHAGQNQSITTLLLRREYACTGLRPLPGRGKDGENAAIKAYDISEAERDGTLEYTAPFTTS